MENITQTAFGQMRQMYMDDKDTLRDVFLEMGHDEMTEILLGAMEYTCQGFATSIKENAEFNDLLAVVAVNHSKFANQFKFVVEGASHGAPTSFLIRMLSESANIANDMARTCADLIVLTDKIESAKGAKSK